MNNPQTRFPNGSPLRLIQNGNASTTNGASAGSSMPDGYGPNDSVPLDPPRGCDWRRAERCVPPIEEFSNYYEPSYFQSVSAATEILTARASAPRT